MLPEREVMRSDLARRRTNSERADRSGRSNAPRPSRSGSDDGVSSGAPPVSTSSTAFMLSARLVNSLSRLLARLALEEKVTASSCADAAAAAARSARARRLSCRFAADIDRTVAHLDL